MPQPDRRPARRPRRPQQPLCHLPLLPRRHLPKSGHLDRMKRFQLHPPTLPRPSPNPQPPRSAHFPLNRPRRFSPAPAGPSHFRSVGRCCQHRCRFPRENPGGRSFVKTHSAMRSLRERASRAFGSRDHCPLFAKSAPAVVCSQHPNLATQPRARAFSSHSNSCPSPLKQLGLVIPTNGRN